MLTLDLADVTAPHYERFASFGHQMNLENMNQAEQKEEFQVLNTKMQNIDNMVSNLCKIIEYLLSN